MKRRSFLTPLAIGLVGLAVNYFAWTQMVHSGDKPAKQDAYGWVFFVGACVFALFVAIAVFMFFKQSFSSRPWGKPVGVLSAVVAAICLMMAAFYWPYFLASPK